MSATQVTRILHSGRSFKIKQGQTLRVIDPLGRQVSDLFAFDEHRSIVVCRQVVR